jgi:long-chain acyl-CoA synthetase
VAGLNKTVLLTGATGFIGTQTARVLLEDKEARILALVRAENPREASRRLSREWWDWPELTNALGSKIEAVCGDICSPSLGLDETHYRNVIEKVTHIIHAAADLRLVPIDELRKTNVQGTSNVLELATRINKNHQLGRFSYISTAYVAGGRSGVVPEEGLTDRFGFFTDYERSKYEGELLVQRKKTSFPVSIFRPSMVVGDSRKGAIKTFNTFYFPLRLYLTGRTRFTPVNRSLRINIVPVDYVARSIATLTFDARADGLTFHVIAPYESLPTLGELLEFTRSWAKSNLGVSLPSSFSLPMSASSMKALLSLQRFFERDHRVTDALVSLAPYFSEKRRFSRDNMDRLLGPYDLRWRSLMPKLLDYAVYHSFFHRSERTVHEQVLFRLNGASYPITYYDIVAGKVTPKSASEMRRDILEAASALCSMGVRPGDRVALTGLNSTRYLAADIATGLVGAVSVPLYYTTPPADIDEVLEESGSKLFFVGMPSLLHRVNEVKTRIPIVSLCRDSEVPETSHQVIPWREFLSRASDEERQVKAPVGFNDIATVRYSSGTTGKPKGAVFRHDNLRYMAESIVSITPWRARNRRCSYLSFLPMGHVVEGILATYSPYYIPAPVEIWFLEEFGKLAEALPRVRPTIFFSVPRIYERVWESLEKNTVGGFYVKRKRGLLKRAMRRIVRRMTLKRAGLDKCAQLIAGSARSDEDMLQNFRELGIEIHNAYGLTEAPLVTINRLGRNRLGTVGEPMPMTEVRTAVDNEIMVRGPQVTAGYFDKSLEPPFKDGWFMTGDLGRLTGEGSLVILGRKKELIKTSYGKFVFSGKVEGMMKEISGVSEAMLVGESKPYCSALMWVPKRQWGEETWKTVDDAVLKMNERLSNPERVKKWALLVDNLSVENGDLTPNLKLKRGVMAERFAPVVEALYGGALPLGDVHVGGQRMGEAVGP